MRVKCIAQEHNTMTRPGLEPGPLDPGGIRRTNHKANASPLYTVGLLLNGNNFKVVLWALKLQVISI